MITKKALTTVQAQYAMENGEFGFDVIHSAPYVIVLMTQDWCPQWKKMNEWLYDIEIDKEVLVYELVYNKETFFQDFRTFKEDKWHNFEIPYLRFYHNGNFMNESNAVERRIFKTLLDH